MKYLGLLIVLAMFTSCMKGIAVDTVIHNAKIHTMDDKNTVAEAMAIRDGKIVEVGPERQILNKYSAGEYIDLEQKDVFPGLADAHGHIMAYARQKLSADLVGTKSFNELIARVEKFGDQQQRKFIVGRGWDQSLWGTAALPDNKRLNALFPNIPVILYRVDLHAALVNDAALKLAGITAATQVEGGEVKSDGGTCTGLLLDNAINLVSDKLPDFSEKELMGAISEIQSELLQYGITYVHEAGVSQKEYQLLRKMALSGKLDVELYVMLMANEENLRFALQKGKIQDKNLVVRSFKIIGDGSLGSRGAFLKKPYSDDTHTHGFLTTSTVDMERVAEIAAKTGYQVNVHAIGDSTNAIVLNLVKKYNALNPDQRWRIEHAQVIDPKDFALFAESGAFPSVQPTHAVSDQRWAEARLGKERLKGAYAYRTLLENYGMLALGTDFPVEQPNPFLTIHAAVNRMTEDGSPAAGFLPGEALTPEQCLRGMTIWPAIASFQEKRIGSLEKGKEATFAILSFPFNTNKVFSQNYADKVYVRGKDIYSAE